MFSGIILGLAPVVALEGDTHFKRYAVEVPDAWLQGVITGASIAIDGVCQTVVAIDNHRIWFEAIDETLSCTTLDTLSVGRMVNVERALRVGDEIGGHQMSGHVCGTATIASILERGQNLELVIELDPKWSPYVIPKGFVGIDGASLTVGRAEGNTFSLHLIPETRKLTTLGSKAAGDRINLELDAMSQAVVDTVERVLLEQGRNVS